MSQSLTQIYLHLVYSTKSRQPFFQDGALRQRVFAYLAGTCKNLQSPSLIVGGYVDHVHILCRQAKTLSVATLIRELKRESSKWIKEQGAELSAFQWQNGYGAFSISPAHVKALTAYIAEQESHHQRVGFQDEFRRLCRKYGLEIDERYCWD
jgi:REP element-mobilizing transposase RayT